MPQAQEVKTLDLSCDDATALRCVIRQIYGVSHPPWHAEGTVSLTWQHAINVVDTAEKFLEPSLAEDAEEWLYSDAVQSCKNGRADVVCDMLYAMHNVGPHCLRMPSLINKVAIAIHQYFPRKKRVRTYFSEHPEVMMRVREAER